MLTSLFIYPPCAVFAACAIGTSRVVVHSQLTSYCFSPELSDYGRLQIGEVTETLKGLEAQGIKVDKIISSPLIRCVQTSDIVADALGVEDISIEYGVMEEAKSFRGHPPNEPAPVWTPLVLSRGELSSYSNRLNDKYQSMVLKHEEDFSCTKNGVREVHLEDETNKDPVQVTSARCRLVINHIEKLFSHDVNCILIVSHYAIVKGIAAYLHEGGLEGHMKVGSIGCFRKVPPQVVGDGAAVADGQKEQGTSTASTSSDVATATTTTTTAASASSDTGVLSQSISPATVKESYWEPISTHWHATRRVPPRPR